jgi:hypothetical protein
MYKELSIANVQPGAFIINLGTILEVDEKDTYYSLVIDRVKERQVFRFFKADILIVREEVIEYP